ncbi:MAG TPA: transketolase C-terminal domain-containing protein [Acidimicrobiia bacterium]|nr:transketolase C-terminal domain-containing protein [Acidimicrobiia bacterium]
MRALEELAENNRSVFFVTGDLGFGVVEPFAARFPDRFLNAGVAEQNMTGVATGLALSGLTVFTYSIANFPTLRCLEQIRNDVCYHRANVKIVSIGGGLAYGALGYSHHALEDLAIMRTLPNLIVVAPGDPVEADLATRALAAHDGPAYLRLGKAGEPICHELAPPFELGRAILVKDGGDVTVISTGAMLRTALDISADLNTEGINARVLSMHTLKPIDAEAIISAATETSLVVTLEEHSLTGGLGSAVAEVLTDACLRGPILRLGIPPDEATYDVGSQHFLRSRHGLSRAAAGARIRQFLADRVLRAPAT